MMTRLGTTLVALVVASSPTAAQNPYPTTNSPITLASGTVVRVRDLVVFRGRTESSLTIYIETPTPAADTSRLAREAHELANLHTAFANGNAISRIAVAICRTTGCSALRERPTKTVSFVRVNDQAWVRDTLSRHD